MKNMLKKEAKKSQKTLKNDEKNTKKTLKNDEKNTKKTLKICEKICEKNDKNSLKISEKNQKKYKNNVKNQLNLTDIKDENFNLILTKKTKPKLGVSKIFKKNAINLSEFENENLLLEKVCEALYNLSHSKVWNGNLMIGGVYHKKYYFFIEKGFLHEKSCVFCVKNVKIKNFGEFVKQKLCNFGLYFYVKNNKSFLKIFCGNGFLIEKTIQNYIEKFVEKRL